MNHHLGSGLFTILMLSASLIALPGDVVAQGAPVIAPEIGQLIAEQGVDAANARFAELIQSPALPPTKAAPCSSC